VTTPPGEPLDDRPSRYARPLTPAQTPARAPDDPVVTATRSRPRRHRRTPAGRRFRAFATIARLTGPPAVLAVVATIALVATLATLAGARTLFLNAWMLSIGALMLWTCWRVLTAALPSAADSEFDWVRTRPVEPPSKLYEVIAIEGVLLDAEWSWRGVEYRLRPLLRKIAASRLIERHQVDLETDPAAAHRILGPELWALVGPGAYGPVVAETPDKIDHEPSTEPAQTRHGRGIPRATIRRAIDLLEAL